MKHIHTLFRSAAVVVLTGMLSGLALGPAHADTQSQEIVFSLSRPKPKTTRMTECPFVLKLIRGLAIATP